MSARREGLVSARREGALHAGAAVRRMHEDEHGQTLVFVLVFLGIMAFLIPPLLQLASAGLIEGRTTTNVARAREAADASTEFGLARLRAGDLNAITNPASEAFTPPAANGYSLSGSLARRPVTGITVVPSDSCHYVVHVSDDASLLPYGATWSVSPSGLIDQGGTLHAAAGTYTITATFANLKGTLSPTIGTACP